MSKSNKKSNNVEAELTHVEPKISAQRLWNLRKKAGLLGIVEEQGCKDGTDLMRWLKKSFGYRHVYAWHFKNVKQLDEEYRGKPRVVNRFRIP